MDRASVVDVGRPAIPRRTLSRSLRGSLKGVAARSRKEGLGFLPAASVALALFLWAERRADEPLFPLDLFYRRVMAVASATGALVGAAMISVVTFVPLYVQSVLAGSPTDAGTTIAPIAIGWPISSTLAGRLLPRTGYKAPIRGGLALTFCAALGLSFLLRPGADLWSLRLATTRRPRAIAVLFTPSPRGSE